MTYEQIKYWNKNTNESKCNWFKLFPENNFHVQDHKVELVYCNVISGWEDLFETTTSEVSSNPNDAINGLNNYWKSKTEL